MDVMEDVAPSTTVKAHSIFGARSSQKPHSQQHQSRSTVTSTPPFRVGGRGSKQLSKAIEKSSIERGQAGDAHSEPQWAFCLGKHPCFAKIVSVNNPSQSSKSVIIQPMFNVQQDAHLFTLWEGHLWMAKIDKIYPVKVIEILLCCMCLLALVSLQWNHEYLYILLRALYDVSPQMISFI
jgi:hypothetical protein